MEKHLKPYQHYSDLYDRFTVEHCRNSEKLWDKVDMTEHKGPEMPKEENERLRLAMLNMCMYFEKGEEYLRKAKTIEGWMERDKKYDETYEQAKAPENITCLTCGRLMFVESRHLDFANEEKRDRVMFFYDCPLKHKPMRVFYDDGEEYRPKPHVCPKCSSSFIDEAKREKNKIAITYTCSKCGYVEHDDLDLTPKKEEIDPDFAKDRERFCLSEKDGQDYIRGKENIEQLKKLMDGWEEKKKDKELYDKAAKLKKLKIIDLENLLNPILEKANYIRLHFKEPDISRDVVVGFSVHDTKADRNERGSEQDLKKLLKKSLKDTNWRLMSDGVNYRLGMLEGRLRGYEREADIIELFRAKEKKTEKHPPIE